MDFFVKIRDACKEELERLKRIEAKAIKEYDPEKIGWIQTEGEKRRYERYPAFQQKPALTLDYVNLVNDLRNHEGILVRNGLFYWLWDDDQTVGKKIT